MANNKINLKIPLSLYKKIHSLMPIACVDIIIVNEKKEFLLLKRKNKPGQGWWWFPGGRVLKNELLTEAALRKAKQETGLNIKLVNCLGTDETFFSDGPFNNSTHTINTVFLAKTALTKTTVNLDQQSEEYSWFSKINNKWPAYVKKFLKLAGY